MRDYLGVRVSARSEPGGGDQCWVGQGHRQPCCGEGRALRAQVLRGNSPASDGWWGQTGPGRTITTEHTDHDMLSRCIHSLYFGDNICLFDIENSYETHEAWSAL